MEGSSDNTRSRNTKQAKRRVRPVATWQWLTGERIAEVVVYNETLQMATMFGRTADGMSLSIRFYRGDEVSKKYASSATDLMYALMDMYDEFGEEPVSWLRAWAAGSD